jgi:hypothetical protein
MTKYSEFIKFLDYNGITSIICISSFIICITFIAVFFGTYQKEYNPKIFENEYLCKINEFELDCPLIAVDFTLEDLKINDSKVYRINNCDKILTSYFMTNFFKCYYYDDIVYSADQVDIYNGFIYEEPIIITIVITGLISLFMGIRFYFILGKE